MNIFLVIHIITAVLGLGLGAAVLLMHKGTPVHRRVGIAYFAAMFVTNVSIMPVSARIMPFFGTGFGFFHVLALISLTSLSLGGWALIQWHKSRDPEKMRAHQINMAFSYLGLVMAAASELLVNPNLGISSVKNMSQFWILLGVVNVVLYGAGSYVIMAKVQRGDPLRYFARTR